MNPFTQPTVARPLSGHPDVISTPGSSSDGPRASRRAIARVALGMLAGAAGHTPAVAVDVNVATQAQLVSVRGIGPRTAQIIIDERRRGGPYESFDDLADRVKGIGASKAGRLQAAGLTIGRRYFLAPTSDDAVTRSAETR